MVTSGSIKLYVIRPSYDLESGIKGAQYAVGTTPGDMDVIKFPESGENLKSTFWLNLPVTEWRNVVKRHTGWNSNINAGYYSISRDNLPAGKKLYISYRTFNKDGKFSGRVVTGPIIIDNTPPLSPVVQITPKINSSSHKVVITLSTSNIYDPESGVEKVVYEVDKKSVKGNWHTSIAWKNLMNITGIKKDKQSSTEFVTVPGKFAYSDMYKVGVRVTNGNGMQRVVWSNPSQIIVNISTINTIGFHGFNH
jgi:hypothetical protein